MNERNFFPQKKEEQVLVDKLGGSRPYWNESNFEEVHEDLQQLKPAFKDFFQKIRLEQPDYLVLLDKGARVFGAPFEKYLNVLQLSKKPRVIFWNDNTYKNELEHTEAQDLLKRQVDVLRETDEDLTKKKIFVVDETYYSGRSSRLLKEFFTRNGIDGHYFAFSHEGTHEEYGEESEYNVYPGDETTTVYDNQFRMSFFPQLFARQYILDTENKNTGITETSKRFQYMNKSEAPASQNKLSQDELKQMRDFMEKTRKRISDLIYQTLLEISLDNTSK
jgi:hypothetical protein